MLTMRRAIRMGWVLGLLGLPLSCVEPHGLRWIVPEGARGCTRVYFGDPSAPPFKSEGRWLLIPVLPSGGTLRTSSFPQWGETLRFEAWSETATGRVAVTDVCRNSGTSTDLKTGIVGLEACFGDEARARCSRLPRP